MNFNITKTTFDLLGTNTEELIRLYGVQCKLILTEKVSRDHTFGDFSHYKANNRDCFEIFALPENNEAFDEMQRLESQFGVPLADTSMGLFVSKTTVFDLIQKSENTKNEYDITIPDERSHQLIGSLVIVPSGKILEITEIALDCEGINNVFLYNLNKNVYKLKARTFIHKNADELENDMVIRSPELLEKQEENANMYNELVEYFDRLEGVKKEQDKQTSDYLDKSDDVFGRF